MTTNTNPIGPLTYAVKGFGDHVERYAFVPNGEPAWTAPTMRGGTATYIPGDSYRLRAERFGERTSSFAVNQEALNGHL